MCVSGDVCCVSQVICVCVCQVMCVGDVCVCVCVYQVMCVVYQVMCVCVSGKPDRLRELGRQHRLGDRRDDGDGRG